MKAKVIRGNILPFTSWQSRPYLNLGHGILYRSCGKYNSSMIANQQRSWGTFLLSDCWAIVSWGLGETWIICFSCWCVQRVPQVRVCMFLWGLEISVQLHSSGPSVSNLSSEMLIILGEEWDCLFLPSCWCCLWQLWTDSLYLPGAKGRGIPCVCSLYAIRSCPSIFSEKCSCYSKHSQLITIT